MTRGRPTKRALITGAGNGLGRSLAVRLASQGWHIGIADLLSAPAAETRALVEQAGGSAEFLPLDVRDEDQWAALRTDLQSRWPALDLLVNNAGVSCSGEVGECSLDNWDWVLSINLRGVILGCHTMVDWLKSNPERSYVLNIGSAAALLCGPGMAAYNVAKAGVVALSQSMYVELRGHNVGVTCACPWFIQTDLLKSGRFAKDSHRGFAEQAMARARVTPERFAREVLDATFRGRLMVVPGRRPKLAAAMKRLFPQTFLNLLQRHISRLPDPPPNQQALAEKPVPAVAPAPVGSRDAAS
ncbi:Diacetyl reductase [(S)-acetoin forming] [Caulifigura coniformis]|uniref:Diacetyl reductase [(S)-acetoin forming] n=1 Tax=Caulifigura coniformis TaxID=2527983 RepID=A0A517SF39_9PLAN|nr:SDR family NAD(P)-dependent oxidoreductase [Caulifigura coniformis]QDT54741.1 Diacetyl reductase [(S)-acetoin forming] [Caulifigura coniformis]